MPIFSHVISKEFNHLSVSVSMHSDQMYASLISRYLSEIPISELINEIQWVSLLLHE